MRVITLNRRDFPAACLRLQKAVAADFTPDLIIGIATGGEYVAAGVFPDVAHASVALHRPSTADKERASLIFRILRRSPRRLADALRIVEARILALRGHSHKIPPFTLPDDVREAIAQARNILVVDDAVDSGATLQAVLKAVAEVPGTRDVRSAVITVTTSSPRVSPDYALYRNSTLIRFPWSKDYYS